MKGLLLGALQGLRGKGGKQKAEANHEAGSSHEAAEVGTQALRILISHGLLCMLSPADKAALRLVCSCTRTQSLAFITSATVSLSDDNNGTKACARELGGFLGKLRGPDIKLLILCNSKVQANAGTMMRKPASDTLSADSFVDAVTSEAGSIYISMLAVKADKPFLIPDARSCHSPSGAELCLPYSALSRLGAALPCLTSIELAFQPTTSSRSPTDRALACGLALDAAPRMLAALTQHCSQQLESLTLSNVPASSTLFQALCTLPKLRVLLTDWEVGALSLGVHSPGYLARFAACLPQLEEVRIDIWPMGQLVPQVSFPKIRTLYSRSVPLDAVHCPSTVTTTAQEAAYGTVLSSRTSTSAKASVQALCSVADLRAFPALTNLHGFTLTFQPPTTRLPVMAAEAMQEEFVAATQRLTHGSGQWELRVQLPMGSPDDLLLQLPANSLSSVKSAMIEFLPVTGPSVDVTTPLLSAYLAIQSSVAGMFGTPGLVQGAACVAAAAAVSARSAAPFILPQLVCTAAAVTAAQLLYGGPMQGLVVAAWAAVASAITSRMRLARHPEVRASDTWLQPLLHAHSNLLAALTGLASLTYRVVCKDCGSERAVIQLLRALRSAKPPDIDIVHVVILNASGKRVRHLAL